MRAPPSHRITARFSAAALIHFSSFRSFSNCSVPRAASWKLKVDTLIDRFTAIMFIRSITVFALLQPFAAGENVRGTRKLAECTGQDSNPKISDPITERVSTYAEIMVHVHLYVHCLFHFLAHDQILVNVASFISTWRVEICCSDHAKYLSSFRYIHYRCTCM